MCVGTGKHPFPTPLLSVAGCECGHMGTGGHCCACTPLPATGSDWLQSVSLFLERVLVLCLGLFGLFDPAAAFQAPPHWLLV
jgi:hypothetical protein